MKRRYYGNINITRKIRSVRKDIRVGRASVEDAVVTDREIIDYLDDHYGLPVKYRHIVFEYQKTR